jgi:hypothetical protein
MTELEIRYRRLLAWYPRDHRQEHESEMLGVLMAAAEPERRCPGVRETADLLSAAVRLHARRMFGRQSGPQWRDVFGVAGVVLMLAMAVSQLPYIAYDYAPLNLLTYVPLAVGITGAVLGRRIIAAAGAWTIAVLNTISEVQLLLGDHLFPVGNGWGAWPVAFSYLWGVNPLVAALALTFVGPRRGLEVIGRPRLMLWSAVAVATLVLAGAVSRLPLVTYSGVYSLPTMLKLTLAAVACGIAVRSPLGRRAVLVLAVPLMTYPEFLEWVFMFSHDGWIAPLVTAVVPLSAFIVLARRGPRCQEAPPVNGGAQPA